MYSITYLYNRDIISSKRILGCLGAFTLILLLSIGAYIRLPLPFTPVPITLQTFFVILGAAFLGRKYATIGVLGYIFLGGLGLPIFQGYGSGFLHIAGPTGGYLIGFIAAAFVIGSVINLYKSQSSFLWTLFSMTLGQILIYLFGITWLCAILKISLYKAVLLGFVPFIPGALFKLIAASFIYAKFSSK